MLDSPSKILVETFYRIMETGNMEMLKETPDEQVTEEQLNDAWLDLQEYYYTHTNKKSFEKFKTNFKNVIKIQNEIIGCMAGFELVKLGEESGYDVLRHFGIRDKDHDRIQSAINRRETKLEFAKNKLDTGEKKEAISFYKIVASVERNLNRNMNLGEITLERWVAYIEDIKERNEAEKAQLNKRKRWQET